MSKRIIDFAYRENIGLKTKTAKDSVKDVDLFDYKVFRYNVNTYYILGDNNSTISYQQGREIECRSYEEMNNVIKLLEDRGFKQLDNYMTFKEAKSNQKCKK